LEFIISNMNCDFIGVYDKAVPPDMCQKIINYFEGNKDLQFRGRFIKDGELMRLPEVKDSIDMTLDLFDKNDPSIILSKIIEFYTDQYIHKYRSTFVVSPFSAEREYNLQRYNPGQGYHELHCENYGPGVNRILAWTLYLNTITDGGGTYYSEYDKTIEAVEGRFCIFPAFWTHTHKGIVSNTETKYIATGWYSYD